MSTVYENGQNGLLYLKKKKKNKALSADVPNQLPTTSTMAISFVATLEDMVALRSFDVQFR